MMKKLLYTLIKQCAKSDQYSEEVCVFNVRLVVSMILTINLYGLVFGLADRNFARRFVFFDDRSSPLLLGVHPAIIFILLVICFPKRKIYREEVTENAQKKIRTLLDNLLYHQYVFNRLDHRKKFAVGSTP